MTPWKHDDLALDLGVKLVGSEHPKMVYLDTKMDRAERNPPRPDVYVLEYSHIRPLPTSYEVKASRADFLQDVRNGKWRKYIPYSERIYFAVPKGLVAAHEVPIECGLYLRSEKGWYSVKAARRLPHVALTRDTLMMLLMADRRRLRKKGENNLE